jgi:predicted esterase
MEVLPLLLFALCSALSAQSPLNPPPGIPVPNQIRVRLEKETTELKQLIEALQDQYQGNEKKQDLINDVVVYYNAVHYALIHDQFYSDKKKDEFEIAFQQLETGRHRAASLKSGKAPWTRQTGLVVRGYRSKIDNSVQPYGLVIPESHNFNSRKKQRLDIWYHGRGNTLSELKFIDQRETDVGKLVTDKAIVLHPYGRYCNANKFAGEVDTFEALDHVKKHYPIDTDRVSVRGFSMGGAVTWHMATHHAWLWSAAAPGAGFAESAIYANVMAKDPKPTWYELKLHSLYDATKYAANLQQCPMIAYSGSIDKQKQAADIMAEYLLKEDIELMHVIGEGMGHKYDEKSLGIINATVDEWASEPKDKFPTKIELVTYTLRYNKMHWLTIDGLEEHWEEARVVAEITSLNVIEIKTSNVSALTIEIPRDNPLINPKKKVILYFDHTKTAYPGNSQNISYTKKGKSWHPVDTPSFPTLVKRHGLQGPIDDAFMDSFIFVTPTGKESTPELSDWVDSELADAQLQWWRQFRGEPKVIKDIDLTEEDIQNNHLVLWGDPSSNAILRRIHKSLPINWKDEQFELIGKQYVSKTNIPVMVYPNPLNSDRYIVLNSSFTFSEFSGGTNSLQIPKLPDWAVLDMSVPRHQRHSAGVVDAGFFDEAWQFKSD